MPLRRNGELTGFETESFSVSLHDMVPCLLFVWTMPGIITLPGALERCGTATFPALLFGAEVGIIGVEASLLLVSDVGSGDACVALNEMCIRDSLPPECKIRLPAKAARAA